MSAEDKSKLKKDIRIFQQTVCADAKAPVRVKAVNTLLNSGLNLRILDDEDIETIWESIFFALWHAEMGRGCEEIIAAVERGCQNSFRLVRTGLRTISAKWYGLDQYRIDKVSHLARHLLSVLLDQQIKVWIKTRSKRKLGSQNIHCKQLLRKVFSDITDSYGLCYFLLEILADEITTSLSRSYARLNITVGKFELKANLIVFLYKQIMDLAANVNLDARLLRTFDQYVIKKFVIDILPNESQLTQILVSLRMYQALDIKIERKKSHPTARCKSLFSRWSHILREVHENCINGEYFPDSTVPIRGTIRWTPRIE